MGKKALLYLTQLHVHGMVTHKLKPHAENHTKVVNGQLGKMNGILADGPVSNLATNGMKTTGTVTRPTVIMNNMAEVAVAPPPTWQHSEEGTPKKGHESKGAKKEKKGHKRNGNHYAWKMHVRQRCILCVRGYNY